MPRNVPFLRSLPWCTGTVVTRAVLVFHDVVRAVDARDNEVVLFESAYNVPPGTAGTGGI